ncbi:MAG: ABC transporter ATP-binding protein [Candidatus Aerophobus sp.]|nr:MAG: ABC transporter ATP-binding protein [Candidatus Aerophobus sp.]
MVRSDVVLKNISKIFAEGTPREVVAVENLCLKVKEGLLDTLLGPSGCGKTTTLRMIAGFEYPTKGKIFIGDKLINDIPPQRRDSAMVFQSYALFPHMTVFENVAYGLKVRRFSRREIKRKVAQALKLVDLEGLEDRPPRQLSGGQQQRVALSRALVTEPKVLLFDEPLSNLDAKLRVSTREELRRLQQKLSITSIYVTHDQAEAMTISDEITVMKDGRVQQIGFPEQIYLHPGNKFVADFIGEANFYRGTIIKSQDGRVEVKMLDRLIAINQDGDFYPRDEVEIVVRPETVDIVAKGKGDFDGVVKFSHYTGSAATYHIELRGGQKMEVKVLNPQEKGLLRDEEVVGVRLHRNNIHLLTGK